MRTVFADTGYWIALINPRDDLSTVVKSVTKRLFPVNIVTSEIVLGELLNSFSKKDSFVKQATIQLIDRVYKSPNIEVIPQNTDLFTASLTLYRKRLDQAWSYVDCSSFILMERNGISEDLTYNRHFEQAGFVALLRQG